MKDLYDTRDLVQEKNDALAARGRHDIRWRWKNAQDRDAGMELVEVGRPAPKLSGGRA